MRTQISFLAINCGEVGSRVGQLDTIDLVAARLAKLEAVQERMRKVNTLVRYRDAKGLKRLGYADARVTRPLQQRGENRYTFYTDNKLRTNFVQIMALRRLKRELESMKRLDISIDQQDYLYREDSNANTISFRFMFKPDKALRALLRRARFVLSPSRNTYEHCLDCAGIAAASRLREYLNKRMH